MNTPFIDAIVTQFKNVCDARFWKECVEITSPYTGASWVWINQRKLFLVLDTGKVFMDDLPNIELSIESASKIIRIISDDWVDNSSKEKGVGIFTTKKIAIVGAGGSGKDYLKSILQKRGRVPGIFHTTRPPREGEVNHVDYHFVDSLRDLNLVCYNTWNGWEYGLTSTEWKLSDLFILTPHYLMQLQTFRDSLHVVYLNIPEDVRRSRLSSRSDADSVERRLQSDKLDFENFLDFDQEITNPHFTLL